jgi:hypothetical protein
VAHLAFLTPAGVQRDLSRGSVQPPGERRLPVPGPRLAGQQYERGLAGVLGAMSPTEHPAAGGEHHAGMATNEDGEGFLIAVIGEAPEQVAVCRDRLGSGHHGLEELLQARRHGRLPPLAMDLPP